MGTQEPTIFIKEGLFDATEQRRRISMERRTSQSGLHNEFHNAVLSGDMTLFQFYLRHYGHRKLLVDSFNDDGYTALQQSCLKGHLGFANSLVEAGSSLDKIGKHKRTALHCAVLSGNFDLVKYLLHSFADVYAKDEFDNLPVDLADNHDVRLILLDYMRKRKVSLPSVKSMPNGSDFDHNNNEVFASRRLSLQTPLVFSGKGLRCDHVFSELTEEDVFCSKSCKDSVKEESLCELTSF